MNNEMPEEVLLRYITEKGMHPKMFYGMLKKEVVIGEEAFWVKDAISTYLQKDESIRVIDVIYKNDKSIRVIDKRALEKYLNSYVCGIIIGEDKDERQRLYIDAEQEAPVQIIPWEYISERNAQSLIDYFSDSCSSAESVQTIHCNEVPLLGTSEKPGHIIIFDTIKGEGVFLKGFSSIGGGEIQYSNRNIYIWGRRNYSQGNGSNNADSLDADFVDVVNFNQSALMRRNDKCFLMVVPKINNSYMEDGKHSVLDYSQDNGESCWMPLPFDNESKQIGNSMKNDGIDIVAPYPVDEMIAAQKANTDKGATPAVPTPASNINLNDESNPVDDSKVKGDRSPEEREMEFLAGFKNYVKNECGFNYDDRDLERFHTCVKTGMMTLLGGDPGSGKSSLFELYARALAGNMGGGNFKRIDVNPTWMEPSDLMGYTAPNLNDPNGEKQFHESQCGLRGFLAELGSEESNQQRAPALICFEEMNLARIELYFAEFIQIISRYEISAEDKKLPGYGGASKQEPLTIPADIRFVGTCNEDPTVKPMSDRFLDRSNVIRLSGDNKAWRNKDAEFQLFARGRGEIKGCSLQMVSAREYGSWVKTPSQDETKSLGNMLDGILSKIRVDLSAIVPCPSPRVVGEILRYVANRPFPSGVKDDNVRLYVAFDEALAQRVISKCVPNALMRGKFEAAAKKVRGAFEEGFKSAQEECEKIVSLTAERLDELERETKSLFQWSGVEDDSSIDNVE